MLLPGKQNFRVVGYLEDKADIKFNVDGYPYIVLSVLSDLPDSIDVPIDYANRINVYVSKFSDTLYDDQLETQTVRRENIWQTLSGLLIEVTPDIRPDTARPNKNWWWGDRVEVQKLNADFNPENKIIALPVFSVENSATGIDDVSQFEKAILSSRLLGKLKADWSNDKYDVPTGVVWETDDYQLTIYTGIKKQNHTRLGTTYILDQDKSKKIIISEYDEHWFESQYKFSDVIYIESDIFVGEYMPKATSFRDDTIVNAEVPMTETTNELKNKEKLLAEPIVEVSDERIIQRLKENTRQKKLYYDDADLINFHISMKTDGMVILSGLSGTGKSRLVSEYANALKISAGDNGLKTQVRFVPVRPFWADDSDLLGYADTVNNVYRPGDSGLIDTLIDAQKNSDDLFIVVFDEMNLARVEHYFSQFLSVLEMNSGSRLLTLYNEELENRLYNGDKYPSTISIGENVLFVGTVNTDESTYQFSDKVLDRSNVITLQMQPFGVVSDEYVGTYAPFKNSVKSSEFQKLKMQNQKAKLNQSEREMLWEIHQVINEMDANVGLGWRIVTQIDKYLMNTPINDDSFTREKAIDIQILQRVLTKVRGSEEQIRPLVGKINLDGGHDQGKLEEIFDKYSQISEFEGCRKTIARKAKELSLYGFTV